MSENPLVSIVIPAYNASRFIAFTIESVLQQTYKNIEIIVVDDGSTDNLEAAIIPYKQQISYYSQRNAGVSAARNFGFRVSNGEFVCFLDADDWFYPSNIELKLNYLYNHTDVGIVHSIVEVTDENLNPVGTRLFGKSGSNLVQSLLDMELPLPCPSNVLIGRDIFLKAGGFDNNLSTSADYELWLRICSIATVGMVHELGIKYRRHSNSMFTNTSLFEHDINYIFKKHSKTLTKYNWRKFILKNNLSLLLTSVKLHNFKSSIHYIYKFIKVVIGC